MTAYELIQRLAKFPADTKIVHALEPSRRRCRAWVMLGSETGAKGR